MSRNLNFVFIFLSLFVFLSLVHNSLSQLDTCAWEDPVAGISYDLTPLAKIGSLYSVIGGGTKGKDQWYVNFCTGVAGTTISATCSGGNTTACQYGSVSAGKTPVAFSALPSTFTNATGVTMTYTGGQSCTQIGARTSVFYMVCDATAADLVTVAVDELQCKYVFTFKSMYACESSGGGGGLGGWIFVIIVLVGFVLFLVVGSIYKWKVKGASGSDVIPLIDFWKDLPGLIKDGCLFAWAKLTCKSDYTSVKS
jgi:hypothetical protein